MIVVNERLGRRTAVGRWLSDYLTALGLAMLLWAGLATVTLLRADGETAARLTVDVPDTQQWTVLPPTTVPEAAPTTTVPTTTSTSMVPVEPEIEPETVAAQGHETVRDADSFRACESAVAVVGATIGVPDGWTITCTHRDAGADKGHANIPQRSIEIHDGPRYEFTVAHELGHAWDFTEIRADVVSARAEREAWLGQPMSDEVWYEWFAIHGETWADHFACQRGWCRP